MKQTISAIIAVAVMSVAADAMELPVLPDDYNSSVISTYFTTCLESQVSTNYSTVPFTNGDYYIPNDAVAAKVAQVWEWWTVANNGFSEDKLRQGKPGTPYFGSVFSYNIPKELEPYIAEAPHPHDTEPRELARMRYAFGYKGSKTLPLPMFVFMHGSGDVANEWELSMSQPVCANSLDAPSIYFVAEIPNGWAYPNGFSYYRWFQKSKQWVWEKMFRHSFLRSDIDPNGLFFIGISEGAYGSQRLGAFYADYLAGIGPMAGGEPLTNCPPENMRHVAFSLRTGESDYGYGRATLTRYVDDYLNTLASKYPGDYVHNVIVEQGQGHSLVRYNEGTTPWLKEYRRNATPKHFNWENFAMDGRYRDGFYNLRVFERANSEELVRDYYEVDIDDNNIVIKVSNATTTVTEYVYGTDLPQYITKSYTPATKGRFKIYLNDKLVDMSKPVTLTVNGTKLYEGVPVSTLGDIVNSIADYYDPERVFTSSIEVDLANMTAKAPVAGIDNVVADDVNAPVVYYNLQGIRVENPAKGQLYIKRQGATATRVVF